MNLPKYYVPRRQYTTSKGLAALIVKEHVQQRPGGCGLACFAMITGLSLDESERLVGKKRGTRTKDLVIALRKLGYKCQDKLQRINFVNPSPCPGSLVKVVWPDKRSHWVLVAYNGVYDPADPYKCTLDYSECGGVVTSFLPIRKVVSNEETE